MIKGEKLLRIRSMYQDPRTNTGEFQAVSGPDERIVLEVKGVLMKNLPLMNDLIKVEWSYGAENSD
jgi:hypothetical protein